MNKLSEGNLYNTEMEISHIKNPTKVGLDSWKKTFFVWDCDKFKTTIYLFGIMRDSCCYGYIDT